MKKSKTAAVAVSLFLVVCAVALVLYPSKQSEASGFRLVIETSCDQIYVFEQSKRGGWSYIGRVRAHSPISPGFGPISTTLSSCTDYQDGQPRGLHLESKSLNITPDEYAAGGTKTLSFNKCR